MTGEEQGVILNVSVSQTLYPVGATTISFPTSQSTGAFKVRVVSPACTVVFKVVQGVVTSLPVMGRLIYRILLH
jgi:hypothetical protein